ncbi:nuclease family protein [Asticcacaulis biprosthecium C19]|uniref:Nuclease family protein n=1 Tax=Asticcacaulis biprosthecium C19 TaxID=715226 RepID=F4QGD6_9CAUL|nr:thermonuclease family protein [Asticcacaulis biprosthecium]EGF92464.1 nuclease family protein [Asticcacaulis biprosthecium C19]
MTFLFIFFAAQLSCSPSVTDGDTIRCGEERIRLLGIDAPEMGGKCRPGRVCVAGDPKASKANLVRLMKVGPYKIERVGTDRYGRTLALVTAGGVDVGCAQLKAGQAVYVAKWDKGGRVRKACGL